MTFVSAAVLLFLVLDPLGNIPLFLSATNKVSRGRRRRVILRESLIAYGVLIFFFFLGNNILDILHLEQPSLGIAGGVILFLIAIKMIFPEKKSYQSEDEGEPFIVPLAIPLIAGPSAIATVLLFMRSSHLSWMVLLLAITTAWAGSTLILVMSSYFRKYLGDRGLAALERLMGLVLTAIAIQMLLNGIGQFVAIHITNTPAKLF
jgi:multiple antibiotic resistance protein